MKNIIIILLVFFPLLCLISCDEVSSEVDYNPNVLTSIEYVQAEDAIFEIVNAFVKGIRDTLVISNGYGYIDNCDVSFHIAENYLIFGYGNVNRLCQDNKYRKGSFKAIFSGSDLQNWTEANIMTDSLMVDNFLTEAEIEIQNLGLNEDNLPEYSLKVISSNIMLPDSTKVNGVNLTTDFLLIWSEGVLTPSVHEDDLYLISGTAAGFSTDGTEFSTVIKEPLYDSIECYWISRGITTITVPSAEFTTGDIDYITEDGCSNLIHFNFNGNLFFDVIK